MPIKLEDGVPIPNRLANEVIEAVRGMALNQSFEIEWTASKQRYMHAFAARYKIKIATRVRDGKMRVWRIE